MLLFLLLCTLCLQNGDLSSNDFTISLQRYLKPNVKLMDEEEQITPKRPACNEIVCLKVQKQESVRLRYNIEKPFQAALQVCNNFIQCNLQLRCSYNVVFSPYMASFVKVIPFSPFKTMSLCLCTE